MKENKIEIRTHMWSEENTEEIAYKFFNRAMAICHIIKENGLINSEEDSTKILKDVLERNPLEYRIESKEVIEYIKNKMEEEGLDPTSIVDRKAISSNEIIQQAVQKIVREKNNDGIKQIKDDFDKWAEERKAQEGNVAIITGVRKMSAASVKCTDLRGGVATVLAGLQAKGRTKVTNIEYILRGYENLDKKLNKLGANIQIEEGD